ncbi:MAG TPA: C39 family peptidase [Candidatus Nitrosocosmicus sp.]|nr:C39 family peptidase [Candidatus Nitrosocosmicus sp.]
MKLKIFFLLSVLIILFLWTFIPKLRDIKQRSDILPTSKNEPSPTITTTPILSSYIIPSKSHVLQTFNNCGPATLSMILSYYNIQVSQQELGLKMRPYQHPTGDNDDKSIFVDEFVTYAKEFNVESLHRPNGDLNIVKAFISNDIPVVVRSWLHPNEDIGHFRIIRGYDDEKKVVIQDDSYDGKDLEISYDTFIEMWQPFNYGYILVYPKDKENIVTTILKDNMDSQKAWKKSLDKSESEIAKNYNIQYAYFNQSVSYYYLKEYEKSILAYEQIQDKLPSRMLWYQIEPIKSYLELKKYDTVFSLTSNILNNNNKGFSELYIIQGKAFEGQGRDDLAKQEYSKAVFYNKNYAEELNSKINSL